MPDKTVIAARLRASRKIAGYQTLKEFCEKFNIPDSTYSQHETGARKIKEEVLENYANLLEVNYHWLLNGLGEPFKMATDNNEVNHIFQHELKNVKTRPKNTEFDKKLFAHILESFFIMQKEQSLDVEPKITSNMLIEVYSDIISTSDDPKVKRKLVEAMLKPYIKLLQKNV